MEEANSLLKQYYHLHIVSKLQYYVSIIISITYNKHIPPFSWNSLIAPFQHYWMRRYKISTFASQRKHKYAKRDKIELKSNVSVYNMYVEWTLYCQINKIFSLSIKYLNEFYLLLNLIYISKVRNG